MERPGNCILVIFGASGDLTHRKLIPSLYRLYIRNLLPERFAVLGVGRSPMNDESFRNSLKDALENENLSSGVLPQIAGFLSSVFYTAIDTLDPADYVKVRLRLEDIDADRKTEGNYLFYLATSPSLYALTAESLGRNSLSLQSNGSSFRRLIVEKPFGTDLNTAITLDKNLLKIFDEEQVFRIDHYLGKETVQNLFVTRFANGIFEPVWNRNYVHHIEITASESIGIEDRGGYYDKSGALRDMIQNHLLQLVALVAMEPPSSFQSTAVRNEKLKVFESLRPIEEKDVPYQAIRGQYTASTVRGEKFKGYREEKNVRPDSRTETYAALKFYIDNWRWSGVPFYIRTGKRLPASVTEIVVHFKPTPHKLFKTAGLTDSCNQLVMRIQPDEGLLLRIGMKVPGAGYQLHDVDMSFHYSELSDLYLPAAYERLLVDAMNGDTTLFIRGDAAIECWRFVDPVLKAWENNPEISLFGYPAGTWGPEHADSLLEESGMHWRYPCKNLTGESTYCEL